ncbi:MAG: ornithine--oxo-acid transaminase [Bdellovibrionales bacterium]|jgi:ornithine--oxo-acid transaminase|nr:ornithine--oxo-acid transaminase [Bdellovibrionales bacterium]
MLNALLRRLTGKRTPQTRSEQTIAHENKYVAPNYNPLPVVLHRGEGLYLWDQEGKKFLDMMSAYSAVSCGHAHPRIVSRLREQAGQLAVCSRAYHSDMLAPFAEKLAQLTGLDMMLPMNTGAEAVETAVKAARLWGYTVKGIPDNAAEIIVAEGNFHGRTTTVVSFSTEPDYRKNFGPFTPGFRAVPFGDLAAIEASITPNTAAVLLEPIQGEAGIKTPPAGFLRDLRALCDKHNVLLVLDEVQSGLGRTGKMFCYQHDNILPDMVILGKALGGGLLPVSAVVGKRGIISLFKPGSHGSTFGGNPLAAAVGLESLSVLEEEGMVENSAQLGDYMMQQLRGLNSPLIREVRGKGLWIGVDFDPEKNAARKICEKQMTRGILSKDTHETVVRFAPPLNITRAEIDWCLEQFREVLREVEA